MSSKLLIDVSVRDIDLVERSYAVFIHSFMYLCLKRILLNLSEDRVKS